MGLFSCCFESRKTTEKNEADTRHARIVEIYKQAEVESQQITQAPPPAYQDIVYDTVTGTTIVVDEKSSQGPAQPQPEPTAQHPISRPASPQTSIYSVPSTRLTDITSAYTGTTAVALTHQGDSPRSSMVFDSAPPSYYDSRSIRERSRSPARNLGTEAESQPSCDGRRMAGPDDTRCPSQKTRFTEPTDMITGKVFGELIFKIGVPSRAV